MSDGYELAGMGRDADRLPGTGGEALRHLLRYAVLAPSSHNTQPWRFRADERHVDVFADPERWLRVADDDRRELFLSVGCALENLLVAAEHFGLAHEVRLFPEPDRLDRVARVRLSGGGTPSPFRGPELFAALSRRRTHRGPFSGAPVPAHVLEELAACVVEEGIQLHASRDAGLRRRVGELVARANAVEFADPAFREELARWIGRGMFGTPRIFAWIAALAVRHTPLSRRIGRQDAALLASSPVLAVLTSSDDRAAQVRAGQALERIWLEATHLGLAVQPMSAPLQVPELKRELAELIGTDGQHPQHLFRLGYAAPERRRTPRRPLDEVVFGPALAEAE